MGMISIRAHTKELREEAVKKLNDLGYVLHPHVQLKSEYVRYIGITLSNSCISDRWFSPSKNNYLVVIDPCDLGYLSLYIGMGLSTIAIYDLLKENSNGSI